MIKATELNLYTVKTNSTAKVLRKGNYYVRAPRT